MEAEGQMAERIAAYGDVPDDEDEPFTRKDFDVWIKPTSWDGETKLHRLLPEAYENLCAERIDRMNEISEGLEQGTLREIKRCPVKDRCPKCEAMMTRLGY